MDRRELNMTISMMLTMDTLMVMTTVSLVTTFEAKHVKVSHSVQEKLQIDLSEAEKLRRLDRKPK